MEVKKLLRDRNAPTVKTAAKLIKVGSWYFWQPIDEPEDDLGEIILELAPYARNRGRCIKFELVPFEEGHLDI